LKNLTDLIKDLDTTPILTNVVTQAQLDIALHAGISFVQGDYLGKSSSSSQLHASELIQKRFVAS
jgi:EAL domain-containing protein (putative c-di-GMP-specific phosphodiesterase class I)